MEHIYEITVQEKTFNVNWELNPGPLALQTSVQNHYTIQIQVPEQFKIFLSLEVFCGNPTSLTQQLLSSIGFDANYFSYFFM